MIFRYSRKVAAANCRCCFNALYGIFSNHSFAVQVVFTCYDCRTFIYVYKPDSQLLILPCIEQMPQSRNLTEKGIYLTDWPTPNGYYHLNGYFSWAAVSSDAACRIHQFYRSRILNSFSFITRQKSLHIMRLRVDARLLVHGKKSGIFLVREAHHHGVAGLVRFGRFASDVPFLSVHTYVDLVVLRHKPPRPYRPRVRDQAPRLRRGSHAPCKGKVHFGLPETF